MYHVIMQGEESSNARQAHFWDWANTLVQSTSKAELADEPKNQAFVKPSLPHLPPRSALHRPSVEQQEYFQNFAQELRDIVTPGMPGMIADAQPDEDFVPPPPPPKRRSEIQPQPPPSPPPWQKESNVLAALPPPLTNAEKIEVRVDQAFADWANEFSVDLAPGPTPKSVSSAPPPPPAPRRSESENGTLPRPIGREPPTPPWRNEASSTSSLRSLAKALPSVARLAPPLPAV